MDLLSKYNYIYALQPSFTSCGRYFISMFVDDNKESIEVNIIIISHYAILLQGPSPQLADANAFMSIGKVSTR